MRYLVTGGAGFIGSHLVRRLVKAGHNVVVVDNLSTGRLENLTDVMPVISFIQGDSKDIGVNRFYFFDQVFHLAASVGVKYILENPVKSMMNNLHSTLRVIEGCAQYKKKLFIASSSEVYGKNTELLTEESYKLIGETKKLRWSYAVSKLHDEFLAMSYFREKKLPVIIGRFFNIVGPGQSKEYGMVFPRFIDSANKNEPLIVYGSGNQSRCFTHINDCIDAVLLLMRSGMTKGNIYNIASDNIITINDLAKQVIMALGSKSQIKHQNPENVYGKDFDDMHSRNPDISKIKKLGYEPKHKIYDIIKDMT